MADWPLIGAQRAAMQGVYGDSYYTIVASGYPAHSKGTFSQLVASTPFDAQGILLGVYKIGTSGDYYFLLDVAVGAAGYEVVIIPNVILGRFTDQTYPLIYLPIPIPAGTRIAARCQSDATGMSIFAGVGLLAQGFLPSQPLGGVVSACGAELGTSRGTLITSGETGVKGSWAQLTANTPHPCQHVLVLAGRNGTEACGGLLDIGIGEEGSEAVLLPDLAYWGGAGNGIIPVVSVPCQIPAGVRLAARCLTDYPITRTMDAAVYICY